jgi:hypothetical protein
MKTLAEIEDMSWREKALDEIIILILAFVQYRLLPGGFVGHREEEMMGALIQQ